MGSTDHVDPRFVLKRAELRPNPRVEVQELVFTHTSVESPIQICIAAIAQLAEEPIIELNELRVLNCCGERREAPGGWVLPELRCGQKKAGFLRGSHPCVAEPIFGDFWWNEFLKDHPIWFFPALCEAPQIQSTSHDGVLRNCR